MESGCTHKQCMTQSYHWQNALSAEVKWTLDIVDSYVSGKTSTILSESTISREIYFKNDELVVIICPLKQVNPLYRGPLFQESTVYINQCISMYNQL